MEDEDEDAFETGDLERDLLLDLEFGDLERDDHDLERERDLDLDLERDLECDLECDLDDLDLDLVLE